MLTRELDYDLPADRIATEPASPRDSARLMVIHRAEDRIEHLHVRDLRDLLGANDLLVFNQSKVIPAWFAGTRRGTGGKVTGLYLGKAAQGAAGDWLVMLESRGKLQPGESVDLTEDASLELVASVGRGEWAVTFSGEGALPDLLMNIGEPPLPPYIRKARKAMGHAEFQDEDRERYNTVYAADPGSVAAPTAGLHFTDDLLADLQSKGVQRSSVTLHVGMGTFAPVRAERLEEHDIHHESIHVCDATLKQLAAARADGKRIIPVGTTTVRTLESLPSPLPTEAFSLSTNLFITPGFAFQYTDALMTNFHLPQSTLLALVSAMPNVGIDRLKDWYRIAIEKGYRFYSYGDAMLIL